MSENEVKKKTKHNHYGKHFTPFISAQECCMARSHMETLEHSFQYLLLPSRCQNLSSQSTSCNLAEHQMPHDILMICNKMSILRLKGVYDSDNIPPSKWRVVVFL